MLPSNVGCTLLVISILIILKKGISYQVQMIESPSPPTAPAASDLQNVRQKLRDSLTSALEMVVSKQLMKSVLGVGADAQEEPRCGQKVSMVEGLQAASLSQVRYYFLGVHPDIYIYIYLRRGVTTYICWIVYEDS